MPFINLSVLLCQNSETRARAFLELSIIDVSICPNISTFALRLAFKIISIVCISIGKLLITFAVLEKVQKFSLVSWASIMNVRPWTCLSVIFPFTLIVISFRWFPSAETIFLPFSPLPFKDLPVIPSKFTSSVALSFKKISCVYSVHIFLTTFYFHILIIRSLEYLFFWDSNTFAVFLLVLYLAEKYFWFIGYNIKVLLCD